MNTSINAPTPHEHEDKKPDKPSSKSNEYKHSILMWFWYALHLEKMNILQSLAKIDQMLDRVILNLIKKYNIYAEMEHNDSVSESIDQDDINVTKLKLQK